MILLNTPVSPLDKILFEKSFDQQNLDYVRLDSDILFEMPLLNGNSEHSPHGFSKILGSRGCEGL